MVIGGHAPPRGLPPPPRESAKSGERPAGHRELEKEKLNRILTSTSFSSLSSPLSPSEQIGFISIKKRINKSQEESRVPSDHFSTLERPGMLQKPSLIPHRPQDRCQLSTVQVFLEMLGLCPKI